MTLPYKWVYDKLQFIYMKQAKRPAGVGWARCISASSVRFECDTGQRRCHLDQSTPHGCRTR